MKDNIKNAFVLSFVFFIISFFLITHKAGSFYNLIFWGMIVAGIIATGIFAYFYKKSKPVYILFYIIALISIYLIGGYFYTSPLLFVHYLNFFYTNHFHIFGGLGNNVTLYNGTYYVPYNVSLYEPVYTLFPFQTKVSNLLNQTITLKLNSDCGGEPLCNTTIEAKYKIINESVVPNYTFNFYCSNPVYLLTLRPEITNPEISNSLNISPELWGYETTFVESAEYNGIIIGESIGDGPFAENNYGC